MSRQRGRQKDRKTDGDQDSLHCGRHESVVFRVRRLLHEEHDGLQYRSEHFAIVDLRLKHGPKVLPPQFLQETVEQLDKVQE